MFTINIKGQDIRINDISLDHKEYIQAQRLYTHSTIGVRFYPSSAKKEIEETIQKSEGTNRYILSVEPAEITLFSRVYTITNIHVNKNMAGEVYAYADVRGWSDNAMTKAANKALTVAIQEQGIYELCEKYKPYVLRQKIKGHLLGIAADIGRDIEDLKEVKNWLDSEIKGIDEQLIR